MHAGLFAILRRVVVEQINELRQRIASWRQRFSLGRHHEAGGVRRQLTEGDLFYIIAVQLGDILRDAIVELQFAAVYCERD